VHAARAAIRSPPPLLDLEDLAVRKLFGLLLVLVLVAAACGGGDDSDSSGSRSSRNDNDDDTTVEGGGLDLDFGDVGQDVELSNEEVIEVVQQYWEEHAPEAGFEFERLPDERISAVPSDDGSPPPSCDGFTLTPADVEQNAFAAPCSEGLTVAWDPNLVDVTLTDLFGETGPAVVFAHEFGHVVQFESGVLDPSGQGIGEPPTVLTENQADCYAGAWVAQQREDGYGPFAGAGSLDDAIGALIFVRDPVGSDPNDPSAHGSGFDRVRAFQDGINQGPGFCATYIDDPPFIEELPFNDQTDAANQGNLPFDDQGENVGVVSLVEQDLDEFWGNTVDGFERPDDPFDDVPEDELRQLHQDIGDGAVATVFGLLWAERAQEALGADVDGEDALVQRSCMVGAWLGDILRDQRDGTVDRESGASLSPGDLDETIITFIQLTEQAMDDPGTAFEAVRNMRSGVAGALGGGGGAGLGNCDL
jgi:Putative neutral zinc metallopeptidase